MPDRENTSEQNTSRSSSTDSQTPVTTLGGRIAERRRQKGLSLSLLADIAGVSKGYLSELESDLAAKPSAEVLYNIAEALDTTSAYLLGKRRNPLPPEDEGGTLVIPLELERFAREDRIPDEDKRRLACIKYRGKQPHTAADWRHLYETLKRMV